MPWDQFDVYAKKDSNNGVQLQIEELNVQISRVFIRLELIHFEFIRGPSLQSATSGL